MSNLTRAMMMGAAGTASDPTYVDDVFSTFLPPTATSDQPLNIDNGIDLAGEGGLVWLKRRNGTPGTFTQHVLFDSERNANNGLLLPSTGGESILNGPPYSNSFDSDGFTWGAENNFHPTGADYASWTFRKAPGFFDIVTYSGDSNDQVLNHSLGSIPGCIIIKAYSAVNPATATGDWSVYHRGLTNAGANYSIKLNDPGGEVNMGGLVATDSTFTLYDTTAVNTTGVTYVAYIFAHDDAQFGTGGDESIIKCGSFTGGGAGGYTESVGFEPQWLLAKRSDGPADWFLIDNMRGFYPPDTDSANLRPNTNNDENTGSFHLTSDGFHYSSSSLSYIYIAIRRPNKPITSGTEVFKAIIGSDANAMSTGFTVDMNWWGPPVTSVWNLASIDRFRNRNLLVTSNADPDSNQLSQDPFDTNDGVNARSFHYNAGGINYFFRRAPGFFDMICYKGTNSARAQKHNLEAVPEFIIFKNRDDSASGVTYWTCWHKDLTETNPYIFLNQDSAEGDFGGNWFGAPSSTDFYLGNVVSTSYYNSLSINYVAYLFATLNGVSKVGSYDGNTGNAINVDCGFLAGARFVLIKRINNGAGSWYVYDTVRGIASGDDPYLLLDTTAAWVTNTDYIDPLDSGFTVTSSAPVGLSETGSKYLFLAIA